MIGVGYYDLDKCPPSYNHMDALLAFESWRRKRGLSGLSVVVLPGPMDGFRRDCLPPSGKEERTRWLNNIVLPMPVLLPSCGVPGILAERSHHTDAPNIGRGEYLIGMKLFVQMATEGPYPFRVPDDLVAKARAKYGEKYVTITERNTGWWVQRTSNLDEWLIVAQELDRAGYKVVLIPDGTKADRFIPGFVTDQEAACNVLARAGLYAGAEMNFGIPNGPMWLCWFLGAPTIICKLINEKEPPTSANAYAAAGIPPGSQLPNAGPRQLLLWEKEEAPKILNAFEHLLAKRAA